MSDTLRPKHERWIVYYVNCDTGHTSTPCWGKEIFDSKQACCRSVVRPLNGADPVQLLDTDDMMVFTFRTLKPAVVCQRVVLSGPALAVEPTPPEFLGEPHKRAIGAAS